MNSPTSSSPTFKNLKSKHRHSPVELKEKMRKNYKDKVQNCRNLLLNRLRGSVEETDLRDTLTEIYKSMFNFTEDFDVTDVEENELLEEIRNELVQEELQWWLQEYEKSQLGNIDWSSLEQDNVICPICQKNNFTLNSNILFCPSCKIRIQTTKTLLDIKNSLSNCIEKHSSTCSNDVQFTVITESNETHIYIICESCMEMQSIV